MYILFCLYKILYKNYINVCLTKDQFIFINDAVFESATLGDTQINVSDLRMRFNSMKDIDAQTGRNEFHKQSEVIIHMQLVIVVLACHTHVHTGVKETHS